ncbi:unnamed protein product, partial [Brenthis ino]
MVIEKVHGLQATSLSLNDRFTLLASTVPMTRVTRPRRRSSGFFSQGQNINNRALIDQIAQHFGQHARKQAVRQRLGIPGLRRFGSEGSLAGLRRSNSFSNLSQSNVKKRTSWRQSNGNLSRSASFNNVSQGVWRGRGFRRRGGRMGLVRGRMRGRNVGGRQQIVGRLRGQQRGKRRIMGQGQAVRGPRGRGGMRGRGRGRGGITRQQKNVPTKEELDLQLDQYMASTKTALDKELDSYMKNAMDME